MTPRERAEQTVRKWEATPVSKQWREPLVNIIESAITSAISDQTAALQAALEELAKVKQERDGLAAKVKAGCQKCSGYGKVGYQDVDDYPCLEDCPDCKGARQILAAHDRKVAAGVLRDYAKVIKPTSQGMLIAAAEYEAGTREAPGE